MLQFDIEVRQPYQPPFSDAFEQALAERDLVYNAASLVDVGYEPWLEISAAVERAMRTCTRCGLDVSQHFKTIYISDNDAHMLRKDWKLSKLAYTLVMLNGNADNPIAAKLQVELTKTNLPPRR